MKPRIARAAVAMSCRYTRTSRGLKDHHARVLDLVAEVGIGDGLLLDEVHRQAARALELGAQREVARGSALERTTEPHEDVQVARRRICVEIGRGPEDDGPLHARVKERGAD